MASIADVNIRAAGTLYLGEGRMFLFFLYFKYVAKGDPGDDRVSYVLNQGRAPYCSLARLL